MQGLFHTADLDAAARLRIIMASIVLLVKIEKIYRRRKAA